MNYSALRLFREGLRNHSGWEPAWRDAEPQASYDVVIVGGGGHGLATAYYLAKEHGIGRVAVIEKGYIGGGNTGRNTTIIRSNYLLEANAQFYELSLKLWEGLSADLNYNVMFSQRGVDIIQNCEATGFLVENGRIQGVETTRGTIRAAKVGIAVAGHTSHVAAMAGLRMPIETHLLQAFVSEPLKPFIDTVVTFGAGHFYVSQSDKGELVMGGDLDFYPSYAQRGNLPIIEEAMSCGLQMFPSLSRLRMLRHWGGVMDMSMDGSPIISKTPVGGLYLNGGWCYGGFKATPGSGFVFAHMIARDEPHPLNAAFTLDRFERGYAIDEKGAGPTPNAH